MYEITLIATNHSETGKCNSDELYKIIESINPDIIFEEMSERLLDIVYNRLPSLPPDAPLELKCIKKYLQNYGSKHYPVDIESNPNRSPEEKFMFKTFADDMDYRKLESEHNLLLDQKGFDYLNSDEYLNLIDQKKIAEKRILESVSHPNLLVNTYKLFYEKCDFRENAMLQNIYNYSKENQYNQAVFLLGAGHRKSIMKKILEYQMLSEIKLKWSMYNN